jgi:uncharacterized RDD family membrane protein YckC
MDSTTPVPPRSLAPVGGDLVSGEAVVLELRLAKLPSRALGRAIDMAIQLTLAFALVFLFAYVLQADLDGAALGALTLVLSILIIVGYPVIFETLTGGRTPGKMALGLRVVRDDGGAVRFRSTLMRALVGVIEIWMTYGVPAILCSLVSTKGKRLGDLAGGTVVLRERMPRQASQAVLMPPALAPWAASLEMSRMPDSLALSARQLLGRAGQLDAAVRGAMSLRLAIEVGQYTSPPPPSGCPPEAFLSAVLAERRRRDELRYAAAAPSPGPYLSPAPAFSAPAFSAPAFPAPAFPAPAPPPPPASDNGFAQPG